MKLLAFIIIIAALTGCAATVAHNDGKTVIIQHGAGVSASNDAIVQARAECEKHGKSIELIDMKCPGRCVSNFRCVPK